MSADLNSLILSISLLILGGKLLNTFMPKE